MEEDNPEEEKYAAHNSLFCILSERKAASYLGMNEFLLLQKIKGTEEVKFKSGENLNVITETHFLDTVQAHL